MQLSDFTSKLQGVKGTSNQFSARCPGHDDRLNSLSVTIGDDHRILVHCHAGCNTDDILRAMNLTSRDLFNGNGSPKRRASKPASRGAAEPAASEHLTAIYDYHDAAGALVFQVLRYHPKTFRQRRPDPNKPGEYIWNIKSIERPLYHLPELMEAIASSTRAIILVEGEKDSDNLRSLGLCATTNAGGASVWQASYSELLSQAKHVYIIPDSDASGRKHAALVHSQIPNSTIVPVPAPHKDISDWIAATNATKQDVQTLCTNPAPITEPAQYFRPVGHLNSHYYFLSYRHNYVIEFRALDFGRPSMYGELAPREYWELQYPGKMGPDFNLAADNLRTGCIGAGIWNAGRRCRGRGAWLDQGRTVLHCGDHLIVDGIETPLLRLESKYAYLLCDSIEIPYQKPININDGFKLVSLLQRINWEDPKLSPVHLAGWIMLAPICGALRWRPHIWLTGGKGTGKSWIMEQILLTILNKLALHVQGSTTEAGLRQELASDALPILFDEAEHDEEKSKSIMTRVLELARQASTEGGAPILKGTPHGGQTAGQAMKHSLRSCFCLSAISDSLARSADVSRVTVLEVCRREGEREENDTEFRSLERDSANLLTTEFCAGLIARSVHKATAIREASRIVSGVIASTVADRRAGDQIGSLLAGYWALTHNDPITEPAAIALVQQFPPPDAAIPREDNSESRQCLNIIMAAKLRTDRGEERTIGELIDENIQVSNDLLKRHGIQRDLDRLRISTNHAALKKILDKTPFGINWSKFLGRIPGANRNSKIVWWSSNHSSGTTEIPLTSISELPF